MTEKLRTAFAICFLPGLLLFVYFIVRINNYKLSTDLEGVSSVIRVYFVVFGSSISYFMSIMSTRIEFSSYLPKREKFWFFSSLLCALVAFDDSFAIHETLYIFSFYPEKFLLVMYGVFLIVLVFVYRKTLDFGFWLLLGLFGTLAVASIGLDNTGIRPEIMGRAIDIEQIGETFALLFLGAAFGFQAMRDLSSAATRIQEPD